VQNKPKNKTISQTDYEKGYNAALEGKIERDSPFYPHKFDNSFSIGRNRHNSWLKGFVAGLNSKLCIDQSNNI
jgi:hypothetical protein